MSRLRPIALLLAAIACVACGTPTAPAPASSPGVQGPAFDGSDTTAADSTLDDGGYQNGHG